MSIVTIILMLINFLFYKNINNTSLIKEPV